tara:strand:+ start:99 stop:224 length:126 start_codon:yes stop_codon:yes gene_type:complete
LIDNLKEMFLSLHLSPGIKTSGVFREFNLRLNQGIKNVKKY